MSHEDFWDRIETVNAGMLDASQGARLIPMSHQCDREANTLWFITAQGTQTVAAVENGPSACGYVVAEGGKGVYAHLKGTLALSTDRAKLEELWNAVADTWFDGGIDDPDVRLLSFGIDCGEVWVTPTSGVRFLFSIAKAKMTGEEPDMGDHFHL